MVELKHVHLTKPTFTRHIGATHSQQVLAFPDTIKVSPAEWQCAKVLVDGFEQ